MPLLSRDQGPLVDALMKFGLSEYEAMIYITLLSNGPLSVKEITVMSGVPRTKIYPALQHLAKWQLVSLLPEKPLKAKANPPDKILAERLKPLEAEIKQLKKAVVELNRLHRASKVREAAEKHEFWVIKSEAKVASKIGELVSSAGEEVCFLLREDGIALLLNNKYYNEVLLRLMSRSREVHVAVYSSLTDFSGESLDKLRLLSELLEVQYVDYPVSTNLCLVDGRELLLFKRESRWVDMKTDYVGALLSHDFTVNFAESLFRSLSQRSRPAKQMLSILESHWLSFKPRMSEAMLLFSQAMVMSTYQALHGAKNGFSFEVFKAAGKRLLEYLDQKEKLKLIGPTLEETLKLLASFFTIYDGVPVNISYDKSSQLLTLEVRGDLPAIYREAAFRELPVPPSPIGLIMLGVLEEFGYNIFHLKSSFDEREGTWLLQYRLVVQPLEEKELLSPL
ncbi:MAG TPA: TrmB family transcriptional regulator [Candidatus Methanomethylia archaeon]|nr:TrmB family transcriptional regulator [Candidatus Methanomethylicia archaeon]